MVLTDIGDLYYCGDIRYGKVFKDQEPEEDKDPSKEDTRDGVFR